MMLKSKLDTLIHSKFMKNASIVVGGTALAQVITMFFSPLITRLYSPEAFGVVGIFMAIITVVTPVAALTFPFAIALPKDDSEAKGIVRISIYFALSIAAIATLFFYIAGDWVVELLNIHEISNFILLIPLLMLLGAILQVIKQWLLREKQFKLTAKVAIHQSLIINSSKIGIGWFYPTALTLVLLTVVGQALYSLLLVINLRKEKSLKGIYNSFKIEKEINLQSLVKKYIDFPLYRTPQVLLNAFSQSLPLLMLASFFGPASAGFYALGRTVLLMPIRLISNSVGDVFYPRISEAVHNGENLTQLLIKTTIALSVIGIIPFGIIILYGPTLFSFIFGSNWLVAGEYARWLALWLFFMFIQRPCVMTIPVINEQAWFFRYEIFSAGLAVLALWLGFFFYKSDSIAIMLYSLSGVLTYLYLIIMVINKSKHSIRI